jgi:hypothetical protein
MEETEDYLRELVYNHLKKINVEAYFYDAAWLKQFGPWRCVND